MLLGGWPVWVAQAVGAFTTIRETVSIRILPHGRRPPSKSNAATRESAPLYLDLLKLFLSAALAEEQLVSVLFATKTEPTPIICPDPKSPRPQEPPELAARRETWKPRPARFTSG